MENLEYVNNLKPGDILYLRGGVYYVNETINVMVSGLPDAYITIRNYPGETPVLYGSDKNILNGKIKFSEYEDGVYYANLSRSPLYVAQDSERLYHYKSLEDLLKMKAGVKGGWFYDPSTKRLYVATINGTNPSLSRLHVSKLYAILNVHGRYIDISGLEVAYAYYGIVLSRGSSDCVVENCHIHNINRGIHTGRGVSNNLIQSNTIWDTGIMKWPWDMVKGTDAEGAGISLSYAGPRNVVRFNRIMGLFNGIAASAWGDLYNTSLIRDTDIHDNYIIDVGDDGIEPEGSGINLRIWNNIIVNSLCAVSLAPITYGPTYVFRNLCVDFTLLGFKLNSEYPSSGWKYLYHNTVYSSITHPSNIWRELPIIIGSTGARYSRLITRNNIFHLSGNNYVITTRRTRDECSFDYDNLYQSCEPSRQLLKFALVEGTDYRDMNALKTSAKIEINGISADSRFVDPEKGDFRLRPTSPCIDAGVAIPNFNEDYYGDAPDLGAIEYKP